MPTKDDAIMVFTARSPEVIVEEGGSQAWVLNQARARRCTYLVCTQNQHHPNHEFSTATEDHGKGFLIGKISEIRKSREEGGEDRWMIAISEYAKLDVPNVWDGGRNPVRYTSLKSLGITVDGLKWRRVFQSEDARDAQARSGSASQPKLTFEQAKKALAATYGVKPEAIEITIRA